MPTLNGFSCGIYTHEGQLDEYAQDEVPGGLSCFIPAKSGQQFWLSYKIERPIQAKAMSIDFWVDGNRIDTQFALAPPGSNPPAVGPVASTINSQYGKDEKGAPYRREVFFTLNEHAKQWPYWSAKGLERDASKLGIIECKVYRAEKTGVWEGIVSPEASGLVQPKKSIRSKHISHRVRLGASIPAETTIRYTFRNLDADSAPYVYFKFYYRSYKFLQANHLLYVHDAIPRLISSASIRRLPAAAEITRSSSKKFSRHSPLSHRLRRQSSESVPALSIDLGSPFPLSTEQRLFSDTSMSPALQRRSSQPVMELHTAIASLEAEFNNASNNRNSDIFQSCYEKLGRIKRAAEKLKLWDEQTGPYNEPIAENPKEEESGPEAPKALGSLQTPPPPASNDKGKGKGKAKVDQIAVKEG